VTDGEERTARDRRRDRRSVLAGIAGLGGLGGLAGCAGVGSRGSPPTAGAPGERPVGDDTASRRLDGEGTGAVGTDPGGGHTPAGSELARQGVPATVCEARAQPDPGIYAIVDPAFGADWTGVTVPDRYRFDGPGEAGADADAGDGSLAPDATVIGLTADGDGARAYPLSLLWWHEVVNDDFGGPVLVTYCPICRSGMVADRLVGGRPARFLVSGHLWQAPGIQQAGAVADGRAFGTSLDDPDAAARVSGNVVLVDRRTGSFWSQVLARAICGPRRGDRLAIRPATVTSWRDWRTSHPGTDVLLPPPASGVHDPPGATRGRGRTDGTPPTG
jgi:hypothetical protein